MHQNDTPQSKYFLNRIAMERWQNPEDINPIPVLKSIFEFAHVNEILEDLHLICDAAMHEEYTWQQGSPGNALFYANRLEELIEACYLLQQEVSKKKYPVKMNCLPKKLPLKQLPVLLSKGEFQNPIEVIKTFFIHAALPEWKQQLYMWTDNALSKSSVKDELPAETLLPFTDQMRKLIYAASLIINHK